MLLRYPNRPFGSPSYHLFSSASRSAYSPQPSPYAEMNPNIPADHHLDRCFWTEVEELSRTFFRVAHRLQRRRNQRRSRIGRGWRLQRLVERGVSRVDGAIAVSQLAQNPVHFTFEPCDFPEPYGVNFL